MNLRRRGFLQSAMAFVIAPGLVKPETRIKEPVLTSLSDRTRAIAKVILDPIERLQKYRAVLITQDGRYLKGPKVEKVEYSDSAITFYFQKIIMQETIGNLTLALFSPEGEFRISRQFLELHRFRPGDELKATYMIGFVGFT